MSEQNFIRFWGDNASLVVPMVHPDTGDAFSPAGHNLLFTVKRSLDQTDAQALVQKLSTIGGIATAGSDATVSLVPADWTVLRFDLAYYYSLKAVNVTTGAQLTVAAGRFSGRGVAGRGASLSIDTTIVTPPASLGQDFRDVEDFADSADIDITEIPTPYLFGVTCGRANMQWWRVVLKLEDDVENEELIFSTVDDTRCFFRVG